MKRYPQDRKWLSFFRVLAVDASVPMWEKLELSDYSDNFLQINHLAKKAIDELLGNTETVNQLHYTPKQLQSTVANFLQGIKKILPNTYYSLYKKFVLIHEGLQPISGSNSHWLFCQIFHRKLVLPTALMLKEKELISIIYQVIFQSTNIQEVENLFVSEVSKNDSKLISYFLSEESLINSLDCVLSFFEIRLCWKLIGKVLNKSDIKELNVLKNN